MVTVDLIGRLGNQMFQIATVMAHAKRQGVQYGIPLKSRNWRIWPTYFHNLPLVQPPSRGFKDFYKEPEHYYIPIPPNLTDVRLEGYFQSEKYFSDFREEVLLAFRMAEAQINHQPNSLAIHIRRGDYVQMPNRHPVISDDYLKAAIEHILNNVFIDKVFIFSDDPNGAADMLKRIGLAMKVTMMPTADPVTDLKLMAGCAHQIISNSSYSWWAAWVNPNPYKIIVAPKVWFGPENAHLDTRDLIPETWVKI